MSDTTRLTFDQTLEALGAWEGVPVAVEVLAVEAGDVHSLVHVPVTIVGALELIAISDSDIVPNGRLAEYFVDRHARITIDQAFFRRASSLETVIVLQLDGCVLSFERVRDDEATEEPGGPPPLRLVRPPDGSVHSRRGPENGKACVRAPPAPRAAGPNREDDREGRRRRPSAARADEPAGPPQPFCGSSKGFRPSTLSVTMATDVPTPIAAAAARKREGALARASSALRGLDRAEAVINFQTVARAAGVSRQWLYETPCVNPWMR